MTSFQHVMELHFPKAVREKDYVARTYQEMLRHGFGQHNTIACVAVCRDELNRPFLDEIARTWGRVFDCSGLAGMLFLGKTGFLAARTHSPVMQGRERLVYYAMPHIAIGRYGEPGLCERPGRAGASVACGALSALSEEAGGLKIRMEIDPDDIELSILRYKISKKMPQGTVPDLIALTRCAYEIIAEDLKHLIDLTVDKAVCDYALFTGIQIHAPDRSNYVWPGEMVKVINGKREPVAPILS